MLSCYGSKLQVPTDLQVLCFKWDPSGIVLAIHSVHTWCSDLSWDRFEFPPVSWHSPPCESSTIHTIPNITWDSDFESQASTPFPTCFVFQVECSKVIGVILYCDSSQVRTSDISAKRANENQQLTVSANAKWYDCMSCGKAAHFQFGIGNNLAVSDWTKLLGEIRGYFAGWWVNVLILGPM